MAVSEGVESSRSFDSLIKPAVVCLFTHSHSALLVLPLSGWFTMSCSPLPEDLVAFTVALSNSGYQAVFQDFLERQIPAWPICQLGHTNKCAYSGQ